MRLEIRRDILKNHRIKSFFKEIRRALRLQRIFAAQHLKKLMEYKIDFVTGAVSFFVEQVINIAFLAIIFGRVESLRGWNYYEILFIYGFSLFPKGIDHLFCDNLWNVSYWMMRKGEFDKYLTRPIDPLLTVTVEVFQVDAFGELIVGIALIITSVSHLKLPFVWYDIPLALVAILFGMLIYTAIKIIFTSIAFWTKRSGHLLEMAYSINQFSQYPVEIYSRPVRNSITFIIPFAFTAFYPASYLLRHTRPVFSILGTVVAAVLLMTIALLIWNKGMKAYESAGS